MTLFEPFFTEEDIFYHRLIKLKRSLKVIALSRLTIDHLDKMGIPKSHINYREKHKKYKNKKTEESEYSYTIATFSYNKQNFTLYKSKKACSIIPNISNSQLQHLLELRTETDTNLKNNIQNAALYCNSLNTMSKKHNTYRFNVDQEIQKACLELEASNEYSRVINSLCSITKQDTQPEYYTSWRETQKNTFNNRIIDLNGVRYRSKNEIISSICADSCGLFIEDEPFYPGTKLRADFGVMCANASNDKSNRYKVNEKYVEILGKCGDKAYDNKTAEKQELAKKLGMHVLFINMTDEFNNLGSTTHFDMRKIEKLLIRFYFKNDFSNDDNAKICLPY